MTKEKQKIVYLTIDDCPSKDFIEKIDYLCSNNIKAILFCTGKKMKKNSEEIIYAIKRGFIIGNHSYSHLRFSIITPQEAERQIKVTEDIINILYKKAKVKRKFKIFRFPYGDPGTIGNKSIFQFILKKYGYKKLKLKNIKYKWFNFYFGERIDLFWTYDFTEYKIKNIRKMIGKITNMRGNLNDKKTRDILLLHDKSQSTKLFYKIMNGLIERNIKFVLPDIR
jgi:peptidoglycan/xylan/chitin deacetylase (PgdA/CDA1 family)